MAKKNVSVVPPFVTPNDLLLLDIPAAARALSASVWAVRGLLWDGKLPYIKIGRRFLIDPADLRTFIERAKADAS